jgi:hypothetical protein
VRIALFTPFSPELGGGSAQLRSHLRYLPDLDIQWYYLANRPAANSDSQHKYKWLGPRLTTVELLSDLSARTGFLPGSKSRVRNLLDQMQADLYWVVGHYEGISVAAELISQGKKVHLTIHDDPFGTWIRSERYAMFRPVLRNTFPRLLRAAHSVDVTSWGMRNLYRQKYGVKCFALYLHVPALPQLTASPEPSHLSIGHIGTLYQPQPFLRFVSACKKFAAQEKRQLRIVRIGSSPEMDLVAAADTGIFASPGDLSEEDAIPVLAACDLLYAMYPAGKKYELFRRTSLPIKVSSYVQAQRPIFAQTPGDSTLACIVAKYKIGQVCLSQREDEIARDIPALLDHSVAQENFERARSELMGKDQLQQLAAALRGQAWQEFPESDCTDFSAAVGRPAMLR